MKDDPGQLFFVALLALVLAFIIGGVLGWVAHSTIRTSWTYHSRLVCDAQRCVERR